MTKKITRNGREIRKILLSLGICALGIGPLWGEMDCQKSFPVPALATDKTAETQAAVDIFKGFFRVPPISAEAKMKATMAQHDVLARYPNADVVALRQQELSYVCQLLNDDKTLRTAEKASILQSVGEGSIITKPMIQRAQAYGAKLQSNQSNDKTTVVGNGNAVGNGNTVINGDHNQIQISQPPPNPYAAQTTFRMNGIKNVRDDSAGSVEMDTSLEAKYFLPIAGAEARGEWNEMLRLSDMAIREEPAWFTPYYLRGRALIHLCHQREGIEQLNAFISAAQNATQFGGLVQSAKININDPNTVLQGQSTCK